MIATDDWMYLLSHNQFDDITMKHTTRKKKEFYPIQTAFKVEEETYLRRKSMNDLSSNH